MLVFSFLRLLEKERSSQSSKHSEPGVRKPEGTLELFSILQILKDVANVSSLLKTHLKGVIPSSSFPQVRYLSFPGENEDVPPAVTSHSDGFQETGSAVSPSREVEGPPAAEGAPGPGPGPPAPSSAGACDPFQCCRHPPTVSPPPKSRIAIFTNACHPASWKASRGNT